MTAREKSGQPKQGRPKNSGGIAGYLDHRQLRRLKDVIRATPNYERNMCILHICLGTGMRIGEVLSLKVGDVWNFYVDIQHAFKEIRLIKRKTKSKKSRTVMVTPLAQAWITRWIKYKRSTYGGDCTRNGYEPDSYLFPATRNPKKPMTSSYMVTRFQKWFEDAGLPGYSTHSFRRTHITDLARKNPPLPVLQEHTGHANVKDLMLYISRDPNELRAHIDDLGL